MTDLEAMFKEADETGKWFWCHYQDLWFSPDKLRKEQAEGRFRWGAVNWKLRDPAERVLETEAKLEYAKREHDRVLKQLNDWKNEWQARRSS